MKKIIAFILCLSIMFTFIVTNVLADQPTVKSSHGHGQGTSFYCTAKIAARKGWYNWATCTIVGTYKVDKYSNNYTESDTAEATGAVSKELKVTARCWARAENHLWISCYEKDVRGAQYEKKK